MRAARDCFSFAATAAAALGFAGLALILLGFWLHPEAGSAHAESQPQSTIAQGRIDQTAQGAPADGVGGRDPERPVDTAAQFVAVYNVSLGSFNLGSFQISGTVQDGQYRMRGGGNFSVLKGFVFNWQASINGSGLVTTAGPSPASYSFNQSDGKMSERLRIDFGDGYVKSVTISPRRRPYPGTIPVRKEQLQDVVDPLSGIFLTARSDDPRADLGVCNQLLPMFDGRSRFDLVLKPKKRVMVRNNAAGPYSGPAAVCGVKFIPISGYPRGDPGIEQLRQSNQIEVWLIPLRGTDMYVPYRIVMPTTVGFGTAVVTSLRVGRPRRASAE